MRHVGWDSLIEKIGNNGTDELQRVKRAIIKDLQDYKQADSIHFEKGVFFVSGVK
jgi:hypothetical protein